MIGPSFQYAARMLRVIDGDTYEVEVDLGFRIHHVIHVRLKDFDTAELRSSNPLEVAHARAAREFVDELLPPGAKLILLTAKLAIFNRWQAEVWYRSGDQDRSLAVVLASAGYAKQGSYP